MLAPSIFRNVPESERCIVEVSRKIETLRRYVQFVESQGGEASHAKYAMQSMCSALVVLRRQRNATLELIGALNSVSTADLAIANTSGASAE